MIERAAIHNFKAFQFAEIGLSELTLFTGMNGVGKSTFIQIFLLLRQGLLGGFGLRSGIPLNGELINLGQGKDARNFQAEDDILGIEIDFTDGTKLKNFYKFDSGSDFVSCHQVEFSEIDIENQSLFKGANFQYLHAERKSPTKISFTSDYQVLRKGFLGIHGEYTDYFLSVNQRKKVENKSVILENAKTDLLLDQVTGWYKRISPGIRISATHFPEHEIAKVLFQYEIGKNITPHFSQINSGFGFTYVLPVITAVVAAHPGDLVIIENPESHLHPQGQAILGELLSRAAAGGVQLIIESHSDHLLNGIRVAVKEGHVRTDQVSVYYFERDSESEEHVTEIIQSVIDANGRLSCQPNGFFDEYAKLLDRLLA